MKHKLASSVGRAFLSARCRRRRRRSPKSIVHTAANGNTNSLQRYRKPETGNRKGLRFSSGQTLNLYPTPVILIRTRYLGIRTIPADIPRNSILQLLSTINCQLSTINHQPSTINHQPSTINHQPSPQVQCLLDKILNPTLSSPPLPVSIAVYPQPT